MHTLDELRAELTAAVHNPPAAQDRLSDVRRRIATGRRRRASAAVATAVGALAVAVLLVPQIARDGTPPVPTSPTPSITEPAPSPDSTTDIQVDALPEYQMGGTLIAHEMGDPTKPFNVSFTPDSRSITLAVDCYVPSASEDDLGTRATFSIAGRVVATVPCWPDPVLNGSDVYTPEASSLVAIQPGQTNVLRFSVRFEPTMVASVNQGGRIRIGVYQKIPLASYRFPPKPATPAPLDPTDFAGEGRGAYALWSASSLSDFDDETVVPSTGTWSKTVVAGKYLLVDTWAQAPGTLTITVNGRVVGDISSWDYTPQEWGGVWLGFCSLQGHQVTLTVTAERFPKASWAVLMRNGTPSGWKGGAPPCVA